MTYKEMCETISKHWAEHHNVIRDAKSIFNYSPTGELFMVHEWYDEAVEHEKTLTAHHTDQPS
jgi:hypothetical protein